MNKLKLTSVMIIWGSLGVFTKSIPLSALNLAFLRAFIALPVLYVVMKYRSGKIPKFTLLKPYILSGVLLGIGWLTLFYGYKHTNIASAVIIYNMCPVYVMLAAPFVLKERMSWIQGGIILLSFTGLILIVSHNLMSGYGYLGMALSGFSGICYALIVLINRGINCGIQKRVDNHIATFVQILTATLVLLPFVIMDGQIMAVAHLEMADIMKTVLLGVLHTGVAYTLFFSVYEHMQSVEIVSYSYLEPMFGIAFSLLLLGDRLTFLQIGGGILILGSTYIGEVLKSKRAKKPKLNMDEC